MSNSVVVIDFSLDKSPRLNIPYIVASQSQKELTHNIMINMLELLLQSSVKDILNTPPVSPVEGDLYLIGDLPTDEWTNYTRHLAGFIGGVWNVIAPVAGYSVWVQDEAVFYAYSGGSWIKKSDVPGINWKGIYSAATAYAKDDGVMYNGSAWYCLVACTGVTPVEGTNWTMLVAKGDQGIQGKQGMTWQGTYSAETAYALGDLVSYSDVTWYCKADCTGQTPAEGDYWTALTITVTSTFASLDDVTITDLLHGQVPVYNSVTGKWENGTISSIPTGTIILLPLQTTVPDGFLLCDGGEVSKTTYANLYNAIGNLWVDIVPNLTADVGTDWTASASTEAEAAYQAFLRSGIEMIDALRWRASSATGWLKITKNTGNPIKVFAYEIQGNHEASYLKRSPNTWTVLDQDSNTIDSRSGETSWTVYETRRYTLSSPITLSSFKLNITACQSGCDFAVVKRLRILATLVSDTTFMLPNYLLYPTNISGRPQNLAGYIKY